MHLSPQRLVAYRYQVLKPLGKGGLAHTFLVQDLLFDRQVVLKTVPLGNTAHTEMLKREFRLLRGLVHPNLPEVFDVGVQRDSDDQQGFWFYSLRFIEGVMLHDFVRGKRWHDVHPVFIDITRALMFLHTLGVRHGDIKPANILVNDGGHASLIDLSCGAQQNLQHLQRNMSGTLGFVAPEVLSGSVPDARADLYALGVTMRHVLKAVGGEVPAEIHVICDRLTQKDPAQRPAEAKELLEMWGAPAEQVPAALLLKSSFVGRDDQLKELLCFVDRAFNEDKAPKLACVQGPHGVGSTRLLEEAKWRLQETLDVVTLDVRSPDAVRSALSRTGIELPVCMSVTTLVEAYQQLIKSGSRWVFICDGVEMLDGHNLKLLQAFARLIDSSSTLTLLVGSHQAWQVSFAKVHPLQITPLPVEVVEQWIKPLGTLLDAAALHRVSQGLPAAMLACCLDSRDQSLGSKSMQDWSPRQRFMELTPEAQRFLARIAIWGEFSVEFMRSADDDERNQLSSLVAANWIERRADGWVGAPLLNMLDLEDVMNRGVLNVLHQECVDTLKLHLKSCPESVSDAYRAQLCLHQVKVGQHNEGIALLENAKSSTRVWEKAADSMLSDTRDAKTCVACARFFSRTGHHSRVIAALMKAKRLRAGTKFDAEMETLAGSALAALGKTRPAERRLTRALRLEKDSAARMMLNKEFGLVLLREGRANEALPITLAALRKPHLNSAIALELLCNAAISLAYLSRFEESATYALQAINLSEEPMLEPLRFRALSARALLSFRQGFYAKAVGDYGEALGLARGLRLDDKVLPLFVSYATSCQQIGMLSQALDAYQHAYALAAALGESSRKARVSYNLATIYISLGQLDRAKAWATQSHSAGLGLELEAIAFGSQFALAEIAFYQGEFQHAESVVTKALAEFNTSGSRESIEASLLQAQIQLRVGFLDRAASSLVQCEQALNKVNAKDLSALLNILYAELAIARSAFAQVRTYAQSALADVLNTGQKDRVAEIYMRAAAIQHALGETQTAQDHREQAHALIQEMAASLPATYRQAFEQHPRWTPQLGGTWSSPRIQAPDLAQEVGKLRRLLEINRRINSVTTTQAVLQSALDAAIELTGAERGFLILNERSVATNASQRSSLSVSVFRNMDQTAVTKSAKEFSYTIASQVIISGKPLLSLDALSDNNLSQQVSVHALNLKSVLCVPVRTEKGVLGALYLDDRVRTASFNEHDADLVIAVADQVGIALTKATLLDQLKHRAEELENEKHDIVRALEDTEHQLERLQRVFSDHAERNRYLQLVGESSAMWRLYDLLDRIVDVEATVLISGESGTGKEMVARALHAHGSRSQRPFVPLDCGAVPTSLIEAELFGYKKGAFTGASRDHDGVFVAAHQGTLFLDEIGELPLEAQSKLLRVLQEREVKPLGANSARKFDVRLLCATNRDLHQQVAAGQFREDLYYRIAVIEASLPPLRDRLEDIPLLVEHILHKQATNSKTKVPELSQEALRSLFSYHWPGNVRQLENVLVRAALLANDGVIQGSDIALGKPVTATVNGVVPEKQRIRAALSATSWNVVEAAKLLAIPRATFYRKLRRHGLERPA